MKLKVARSFRGWFIAVNGGLLPTIPHVVGFSTTACYKVSPVRFLNGSDLHAAVTEALAGSGVRSAVAFWGAGAEDLIKDAKSAQLICNLSTGGTNPHAIRRLIERGAKVRQLGSLHAKVYIGLKTVVVTSANASANGLALEGPEQTHWNEAGVEIMRAEARDVLDWFDATWLAAQEIGKADLERALKLWKLRRQRRPTVSFSDYDVEAAIREGTLPVTCWWADGHEWDVDEAAVQKAGINFTLKMRAVEVEHEDDRPVLTPGSWLLWWHRGRSGAPRKGPLTISQIGGYEPGVLQHVNGERPNVGAVLKAEKPDPKPFDPTGPRFGQAFREVIVLQQFDALRSDGGPPWFTILQPHLPEFWRLVQRRYRELSVV